MVEFIHTSDWHLGNPFSAFSEAQQEALSSARFEGVERLLAYARDNGVGLLLCAGDQIDNGELRDARVLLRLFGIVASFPEIRVIMIAGNHDPLTPNSVYRRVDPNSYPKNLFFVTEPQVIELPTFGARLLAAPLTARHGTTNPILGLAPETASGSGGTASHTGVTGGPETESGSGKRPVTIGLAHGSLAVSETVGGGGDAFPIPPDFAESAGLDYLALGDWHSYLKAGTRTFYPGTHEPLAFGDNGGSLRVRVREAGAQPEVERIGESSFHWREVARSASDETLEGLLEELEAAIETGGSEHELLRLTLDGYLGLDRFKQLQERLSILQTRLFALFVEQTPALRPGDAEIRSVASEGYMGKVVDRLIAMVEAGDETADAALMRVHEFFRPPSDGGRP